ncbi:MAG TPA: hypothetical protein DCL44_01945 [Elusimicrobia bacterium]|nr:hypothetical protein [Elusimicrobiota bacterium]
MNKKIFAGLAVITITGVLTITLSRNTPHNAPPNGLRDAVADQIGNTDNIAVPAPMAEKVKSSAAESAGLTSLITTYMQFKEAMTRPEITLGIGARQETGQSLQRSMKELQECYEIARTFNANAAEAMANTPKNPDTIAAAKLLLWDLSEMTADNDIPPPVLQYLFDISKKSKELERKAKPPTELMYKIMSELAKASKSIMDFSGPLP